MIDDPHEDSLVDRLSRQGEDALGKLAEELASNPVVAGALGRAFQARDRAMAAQEAAMGALGVPSAADIERLTRRVRSLSQRLEGIEDTLDRLDSRVEELTARPAPDQGSGADVDGRLDQMAADLAALREAVAPEREPPSRAQERLTVSDA